MSDKTIIVAYTVGCKAGQLQITTSQDLNKIDDLTLDLFGTFVKRYRSVGVGVRIEVDGPWNEREKDDFFQKVFTRV